MTTATTYRLDGLVTSQAIKPPCRVATTTNITLTGLQTIDGVALAEDDRVLVRAQTDGTENGIYVAHSTAWQRATDFDGQLDITQATIVRVKQGSTYARSTWELTTASPVVGTSSLGFQLVVWSDFFSTLGIISIRDPQYEVSANGVDDDSAAIQAIYDSIPSGGSILWPRGTYKVNSGIKPRRGTSTIGDGWFNTFIDASDCTGPVFLDDSSGTYRIRECEFSGITIIGNTNDATNHLIQVTHYGMCNVTLRNMRFYSSGGDCLHIESDIDGGQLGSYFGEIDHCVFGDNLNASVVRVNGRGIYAYGSVNGWKVNATSFYRTHGTAAYLQGISGNGVLSTWAFDDCAMEGIGADNTGVTHGVHAFGYTENIVVRGGFYEGNGAGDTTYSSADVCIDADTAGSVYGSFEVRQATMSSTPYHVRVIKGYGGTVDGNRFGWNGSLPPSGSKKYSISIEAINGSNGHFKIGRNTNTNTGYPLVNIADAVLPFTSFEQDSRTIDNLNPYSHGTFTPKLWALGNDTQISTSSALGIYQRVGTLLTIRFTFVVDSGGPGAGTGSLAIGGEDSTCSSSTISGGLPSDAVPYPSINSAALPSAISVLWTSGVDLSAGYTSCLAVINQTGSNEILLREGGDDVSNQGLTAAALAAGDTISGSITYSVG